MPGDLLIYCLLKGIRVNIPKLIINLILFEHLLIRMFISRHLKLLKFDLSAESSIAPSIDINNTLLKRMHAKERAPAPIPQPPPIILPVVPGPHQLM